MVSKKIKILYLISVSVFVSYFIFLLYNYSGISEIVASHINIKGEIDGYGSKKYLFVSSGINFIMLLFIGLLIKNPQSANYPIEINDSNRDSVYKKMQFFLSILSIIVTAIFSYMIFNAVNHKNDFIFLIIYLIISPLIAIIYFNKK